MTNEANDPTSSGPAPRPLEACDVRAEFSVSIADLVVELGAVITDPGDVNAALTGVRLDSRLVRPGDLFVALPGEKQHGAQFAAEAIASGAVGLLTDQAGARLCSAAELHAPTLIVPNPRHAMAVAAATLFGNPSHDLGMLGVTGTNGKTTTTVMIEHALRAGGDSVATIGTLGTRLDGQPVQNEISTITTPEAPQLQELLAGYLRDGARWVAMEVSSHALVLERVTCTQFDVAGFTNLGRDHLDFHRSVRDYFEAKAKLFTPAMTRSAAINIDDPAGVELVSRARNFGLDVLTTGFDERADVRILAWQANQSGSSVKLLLAGDELTFELGMPGEFNVRNAAITLAMLSLAGLDVEPLLGSFARLRVPGRMEQVPLQPLAGRSAPQVYVDFGHTPQAIGAALQAAQSAEGRLIAVFGAGGDRDPDKRPEMGCTAAQAADVVIVTDDNPRSEAPEAIRAAVIAGARQAGSAAEIIDGKDRAHAIEAALRLAEPADRIVILGKGHEKTQEIAGQSLPFDDVSVVQQIWQRLGEQS